MILFNSDFEISNFWTLILSSRIATLKVSTGISLLDINTLIGRFSLRREMSKTAH